jgi:DNA (cytosine-5)-methyltransferase 1
MRDLQRHRLFETNFPLMGVPCAHGRNAPDRFIGGRSKQRTGDVRGLVRNTVEIGRWNQSLEVQQQAMGIDWMTLEELSEAIPPAYTEHIGSYLLTHLKAEVAA